MISANHRKARSLAQRAYRRVIAVNIAAFVAFLLLTIAVHARLLAGFDLAVTVALHGLHWAPLHLIGGALSIVFSAELTVLYALVTGFLLWRAGFRYWSLAPFSFLLLVLLEVAMKAVIHQPLVPAEFQRSVYYPLATVHLAGSFPSGHAIRSAFFCTFPAVLASSRRGVFARLTTVVAILLAVLTAFTRIYLGDHWLSDTIAGLIIGGALALLVATPIAWRLGSDRQS